MSESPVVGRSVRPPGAGAGDVGVIIVDSNGRRDTVEIVLENKGDSIFRCTYVPVLEGPHTVYVTFAGQQIPRSPFTVHISEGRFTPCVLTTWEIFCTDLIIVLDGIRIEIEVVIVLWINVHVTLTRT